MWQTRKKITRHTKRQKAHIKEAEQAPEPDMAGVLELLDWEFQSNMTNMLRILMNKVDSMSMP